MSNINSDIIPHLQQLVLVPHRTEAGVTQGLSHLGGLQTFHLININLVSPNYGGPGSLAFVPYWLLRQGTELQSLPR